MNAPSVTLRPTETVLQLEAAYGQDHDHPSFDPMEELISCILSQHTSDKTSFPAFFRLRERFPTWEEIALAPTSLVCEAIARAGLAQQKSVAIQRCLREIHARTGDYSLECLRTMSLPEARRWLESLPMVGPKTAAIVLNFSFGFHIVPVDTHVHRLAIRFGWIGPKVSAAAAHDALSCLVPDGWAYRLHVQLIKHGRQVCKASKPRCSGCVLALDCPRVAVEGA